MQAEQKTAQLRVIGNNIIAEGCAGQIFWATPTRARLLIDAKAVELVNAPSEAPLIGPSEAPTAGPSEFKEPAEKKYSAVDRDGPSIDSQSSIESGKGKPSSSSAADLVSPDNRSKPSKKRGRTAKSG